MADLALVGEVIHDLDAERAMLGIALTRRNVVDEASLISADFYHPAHERLWSIMTTMVCESMPIDVVTVNERVGIEDRALIPPTLLADCLAVAPIGTPPGHYARIIAGYATRRRLVEAATRIAQLAHSAGNPEEIAEAARAEVDAAYRGTIADTGLIGDDYDAFLAGLDQESPSVATPWDELTDIIGGWQPGALYVVAARPSIGKSILGVQAAIGLAEHGHVSLTSMEMSRKEIQQRATAHIAQVALGRLKGKSSRSEALSSLDRKRLAESREEFDRMKLAINDKAGSTVNTIRSHARSTARRGPLAGIVIDYLGLLASYPGDRRSRYEQVTDWSRQFKTLAQEMQVPVILLAQLNRQSTQRADARPQMSDLRDSGAVEQDADVIMLLHAADPADPEVDLLVAKNRHGELGIVHFTKRGYLAEFVPRHAERF